jgi:two-component system NarL family response regulator
VKDKPARGRLAEGVEARSGSLVVIASQSPEVRSWWGSGLRGLYTMHEVGDLPSLRRMLAGLKPSILVLDLALPQLGGVKGLPSLLQSSPTTKTLLLTGSPEDPEAIAALKAGARGYCGRDVDSFLLKKAVEAVQKGEIWVKRSVIVALLRDLNPAHPARANFAVNSKETTDERLRPLTPRERQIALMVGAGARNKDIAIALDITETTVKAHLTAIFRKLGIADRLRLALLVSEVERAPEGMRAVRGRSASPKT